MAWPPIIAGTLIGLLQVPAILLTTHPLGYVLQLAAKFF